MKVRVSAKGQIVIPAALRLKYGIQNDAQITVTDAGDAIMLKPVNRQYLSKLRGSLKGKGILKALIEERRKDREREDTPR